MVFTTVAQLITNSKIWYGKGTTTTGEVTFYPTTTGTSSGTALFSTLLNVQATAVITTNSGAALVLQWEAPLTDRVGC